MKKKNSPDLLPIQACHSNSLSAKRKSFTFNQGSGAMLLLNKPILLERETVGMYAGCQYCIDDQIQSENRNLQHQIYTAYRIPFHLRVIECYITSYAKLQRIYLCRCEGDVVLRSKYTKIKL